MERFKQHIGKITIWLLITFSVIFMFRDYFGQYFTRHIIKKWEEEILLSDGSTMWVKRTADYTRMPRDPLTREGGMMIGEKLTIEIPDNIIAPPPPIWSFGAVPILLDYEQEKKTWFIVATCFNCNHSDKEIKQWQYEVQDDKWVVVELNKKLIGRSANMFTGFGNEKEKLEKLTFQEVKDSKRGIYFLYKKIVNNALDN